MWLYAQPNYVMTASHVPNDPFYSSSGSWGQPYDDLWGLKKLQMSQAWDVTEGQGVTVAVVDSGVDYTHPDIASNIVLLPGDDVTSCTNLTLSGCPQTKSPGNDPMDHLGHGTHVAGIIAAVGDNGLGVIGVAPQAKIMPVKAMNSDYRYTSELATGINFAAQNGAKVINNSWGCSTACPRNPMLEDAVRTAYGLGAVVVFAAGNSNIDSGQVSPLNMTDSKPIVVASTDHNDTKSDFSNYGSVVTVAAPRRRKRNGLQRHVRREYSVSACRRNRSLRGHNLPAGYGLSRPRPYWHDHRQ